MANEEHLARLKQGVDTWNAWRESNPEIKPDLGGANLYKANLSNANLNGANLISANLNGANLSDASLSRADLDGASLSRANLSDASLSRANLISTNLISANLSDADLSGAYLSRANLSDASLISTNLISTNLSGADLSRANLSRANLSRAKLRAVQALNSILKGATLTGACIQDWNINSGTNLNGVICDYVFLKHNFEIRAFTDRRPHDPNTIFAPGEFAVLVQKSLETVDLIFVDGIDWQAFFRSLQDLQTQYGDENLAIQAIEKKSGGAFVIRLEVPPQADKAEVERRAKELYGLQLVAMEERLALQGEQLTFYREQVELERQRSTDLSQSIQVLATSQEKSLEAIAKMAENQVPNQAPKYDMRGSNFGNFADTVQTGGKQQTIQHNYAAERSLTLAEAAAEIQTLLKQLEAMKPAATEAEQKAFVDRAIPPTRRQRFLGAVQSGGEAALETLPYGKVIKAILAGWKNPSNGG